MADGPGEAHDDGYYQIIDGEIYNKELLTRADSLCEFKPMQLEDVKLLWTEYIGDEPAAAKMEEIDLSTFTLITKRCNMDTLAKLFLESAVKESLKYLKEDAKVAAKMSNNKGRGASKRNSKGGRGTGAADAYKEMDLIQEKIGAAKNAAEIERLRKRLDELTPKKITGDEDLACAEAPPTKRTRAEKHAVEKAGAGDALLVEENALATIETIAEGDDDPEPAVSESSAGGPSRGRRVLKGAQASEEEESRIIPVKKPRVSRAAAREAFEQFLESINEGRTMYWRRYDVTEDKAKDQEAIKDVESGESQEHTRRQKEKRSKPVPKPVLTQHQRKMRMVQKEEGGVGIYWRCPEPGCAYYLPQGASFGSSRKCQHIARHLRNPNFCTPIFKAKEDIENNVTRALPPNKVKAPNRPPGLRNAMKRPSVPLLGTFYRMPKSQRESLGQAVRPGFRTQVITSIRKKPAAAGRAAAKAKSSKW